MTQYEDEFHVTLPSNASLEIHPENRPSHYVTELPYSVSLSGQWEVAATEVQFTREWHNLAKDHILGVNILRRSISHLAMPDTPTFRNDMDDDLNRWRDTLWRGDEANRYLFKRVTIRRGYYRDLDALAEHFCNKINEAYRYEFPQLQVRYKYDSWMKSATLQPASDYIIRIAALNSEFMSILGFKKSESCRLTGTRDVDKNYAWYGTIVTTESLQNIDMSAEQKKTENSIRTEKATPEGLMDVRSIFLYSDVAGYQIVGNEKAQLLGIVPVVAREGERTHWTFSPPYYSRVASSSFKSIRVWLTDHCGDEVKFSNTADFIVTRLHFRRSK